MSGKSMFVRVLAGAVLAIGFCAVPSLQAAERKPSQAGASQGGRVFGIVTAKTDKDITIKAEGEDEAKRYLLAPQGGAPKADLQAALKMVFSTNLVMFQAQGEQDPVLTGIQALHSKTRFGMAMGTVVAVDADPKWPTFDVKPGSQGHTERYVAVWNPATKSVDQRLAQIITGLNVGDKVKVAWSYDERKRATQIQVTAKAKSPGGPGKVAGIVTAKTDKDITIKAEGEDEAKRYLLAPQGGVPKADLQAALKTVFVPNLVMFSSQGQDQPVLTNIRVILPPVRMGAATGTVVARESKPKEVPWVEVKPSDGGYTQRLWPRFVGGPDGFDKEMVRTFGELNVADKVRVSWTYDERLRAAKIQVISRAKRADPARKEEKTAPESSGQPDSGQ